MTLTKKYAIGRIWKIPITNSNRKENALRLTAKGVFYFMEKKLTAKQELFVKEYLVDLNATQAAIRAGYSKNTAQEIGAENLTKPMIAEAIQEAMDKRASRIEITADRVLQEIAKLAFHDPRKFFDDDGRIKPISELDDDTAMALSGVETFHKVTGDQKDEMAVVTKIKTADKGANLERLGRHLKLFTDKIEVDASEQYAELLKSARERRNGSSS